MPSYVNTRNSDVVTFAEPNARLERLGNWIRLEVVPDEVVPDEVVPEATQPTKDELLAIAAERGVEVDRRWGVARLLGTLEEAGHWPL
jgi:hypothetical protein